jgi:YfiH family protein
VTGTSSAIDRLPIPGAGFFWETEHAPVLRPDTSAVDAAFTTRVGGASTGPFESLNVSFVVGDDADVVRANRATVLQTIGRKDGWPRLRQMHGTTVVRPQQSADADAVWTDDPADVVAVLAADCVPVLLVGELGIAAAHAGWRGLVAGVVEAAAARVRATHAWVGPAIGPCCFEIRDDAAGPIRERFGPDVMTDDRHADLWKATEIALGIEHVWSARLCTSCEADLFFSHRRDGGRTGRQALVAALR